MLFRIKSISVYLILIMLMSALFLCCEETERHRTLTFFFDGVPPLESGEITTSDFQSVSNLQNLQQTTQKPPWYVHKAQRDCSSCHGKRRERGFTSDTLLVSSIPNLCYYCHTNYTTSAPYVHGPVAVGQCLFCHTPHKSRINHLLKEKEPELCYFCHDVTLIRQIPSHAITELSVCTDCHNAHAGSTKALLKENSLKTNRIAGAKPNSAVIQNYTLPAKEQDSNITNTMIPAEPESNDIMKVYQTVKKLIDLGEMQIAREYLEKLKNSSAFTEEERKSIVRILRQIELITTENKTGQEQRISTTEKRSETTSVTADGIDEQIDKKAQEITELYYRSLAFYHSDRLREAREGFIKVLNSGLTTERMKITINDYLWKINNTLAQRAKSSGKNQ